MINKKDLSRVRLQLHQAVQLISASGISFLEKEDDDSHTNMQWLEEQQALASHHFGPHKRFRLALNLAQLTYLFFDKDRISEFALDGKTEDEAIEWFLSHLNKEGMDTTTFTMDKHYSIPENKQARGEPYKLFDDGMFRLMAEQFAMAAKLLSRIESKQNDTSPVRCWPHHFDLAFLVTLEANQDPQKMKSVGLGLSPGDGSYDQPYYYVSPWPYPDKSNLHDDALPGEAFWHISGFTSAILKAESYLSYSDMEGELYTFLDQALGVSSKLIAADAKD